MIVAPERNKPPLCSLPGAGWSLPWQKASSTLSLLLEGGEALSWEEGSHVLWQEVGATISDSMIINSCCVRVSGYK